MLSTLMNRPGFYFQWQLTLIFIHIVSNWNCIPCYEAQLITIHSLLSIALFFLGYVIQGEIREEKNRMLLFWVATIHQP